MNKLTDEQVKEFWEWCGIHVNCSMDFGYSGIGTCYYVDDNNKPIDYPTLDLNNLFKYAVPKLIFGGYELRLITESDGRYIVGVMKRIPRSVDMVSDGYDENPALALFWAIYEVIKNES